MKKLIVAAVAATVLAGPLAGVTWATDNNTCTPQEAYTETIPAVTEEQTVADGFQRYSWTGGPHAEDDAPAFPSEDWQANVKGDPHNIGKAGAYFVSHGNSGKGDWFYLEALTKVITVEITPAKTIEHEAVVCPEPSPTPEPPVVTPEPPVTTPVPPVVEEPNVEVPQEPEIGTGVSKPAAPEAPVVGEVEQLPATGAGEVAGILLGALFLLVGGTAAVWIYRNR